MVELSEKILKLCLKYKICKNKGCKRIMPRGKPLGSVNFCPLCRHLTKRELKIRENFLEWYERKGKALGSILPSPMLKDDEIRRLLREIRKGKKHEKTK